VSEDAVALENADSSEASAVAGERSVALVWFDGHCMRLRGHGSKLLPDEVLDRCRATPELRIEVERSLAEHMGNVLFELVPSLPADVQQHARYFVVQRLSVEVARMLDVWCSLRPPSTSKVRSFKMKVGHKR